MKKLSRKALLLICCLTLTVSMAASFTVAYLVLRTPALVNTFVPGNIPPVADLVVPVSVTKTVVCRGDETIGPEGFTFLLKDSVSGETVFTLATDETGKAQGELGFSRSDVGKTFGYLLTEINDGRANVTYSEQTYYLQVQIMLDEAQDMLVPVLHMNGEVVYRFDTAFENMYYVETPVPPTGDDTNLLLLASLLLLSAAGVVALCPRKKQGR